MIRRGFFNNTLVKPFYMTLHARAGELLINVSIVIKAHRMVKQSCLHVLVRRYMYKLLDLARLYTCILRSPMHVFTKLHLYVCI